MKVALLKRDAGKRGGLEKYTARLAAAFEKKGCIVTLLSGGKEKQGADGSAYCRLKYPFTFLNLAKFDRFCQTFLADHPHDIVLGMDRTSRQTHLRAGNGVHAAYLEARKLHSSLWKNLSFRINPLHRQILQLEKTAFEHPDLKILFVNSRLVKEQVLRYYNPDPDKVRIVHNGVEWEEMAAPFREWPQKKIEIADRLKLDPAVYHFLFIGHNFERKGLRPLLHALAHLKTQDFHLSIVGEDRRKAEFENLAADLGLKSSVSFWGSRLSVLPFYQMADALVIPSFYDPFANVTVEALSMGLFVVSSKQNGGAEVLQQDTGAIADIYDIEAFSHALSKAMLHPKARQSSAFVRETVRHLDFVEQLNSFCAQCLL